MEEHQDDRTDRRTGAEFRGDAGAEHGRLAAAGTWRQGRGEGAADRRRMGLPRRRPEGRGRPGHQGVARRRRQADGRQGRHRARLLPGSGRRRVALHHPYGRRRLGHRAARAGLGERHPRRRPAGAGDQGRLRGQARRRRARLLPLLAARSAPPGEPRGGSSARAWPSGSPSSRRRAARSSSPTARSSRRSSAGSARPSGRPSRRG